MATQMMHDSRWTTESGKSWPYRGAVIARLGDAPDEVRSASMTEWVTDHCTDRMFMISSDGAVTVKSTNY